jgi:pimeloyl-ACP methyl ester carboxylesterase
VGHSYGAAVAMKAAVMYSQRVRSVVVYEPTLFHLVVKGDPQDSPAEGIWRAASEAVDAVERGDSNAGAKRFIDFWMGSGAWASMPPARQAAVAGSIRNVKGWRDALFKETVPRSAFAALAVPVLCMVGENSPESSLSVARVLLQTLPRVTFAPQRGLGHMGPMTHPELVNAQIAKFLIAIEEVPLISSLGPAADEPLPLNVRRLDPLQLPQQRPGDARQQQDPGQ